MYFYSVWYRSIGSLISCVFWFASFKKDRRSYVKGNNPVARIRDGENFFSGAETVTGLSLKNSSLGVCMTQ